MHVRRSPALTNFYDTLYTTFIDDLDDREIDIEGDHSKALRWRVLMRL